MDSKDSKHRKKRHSQSRNLSRSRKFYPRNVPYTPIGSFIPGARPGSVDAVDHHSISGISMLKSYFDESKEISSPSKKLEECPYNRFTAETQLINLEDNKIISFRLMFSLDKLRILNLRKNSLSSFPYSDFVLPKLEILDLSFNNFSNGIDPSNFAAFISIQRLDLSFTQLKNLPPEIGNFAQLTGLFIHNNYLQTLPSQIAKLNALKDFDARQNNIYRPWDLKRAIDYCDFEAVKDVYSSPYEQSVNHINIILLGAAGVGKSALRSAIQNYVSQQPDNLYEITVLDISNLSTHEIFFSVYSFYIIVWDMIKNMQEEIDYSVQYWIDLVQSKAPGSQIIIVGTNTESFLTNHQRFSAIGESNKNLLESIIRSDSYKTSVEQLWERLDINEALRVREDETRRFHGSSIPRPRVIREIVPVYLSSIDGNSEKMKRPSFARATAQSVARQFTAPSSTSGGRNSLGMDSLLRGYSENGIGNIDTFSEESVIPVRSHTSIGSRREMFHDISYEGLQNGIEKLVSLIIDKVDENETSLSLRSPAMSTVYLEKLHEYRATFESTRRPPYCTLSEFENFIRSKSAEEVDSKILLKVIDYWKDLGKVMKFDLRDDFSKHLNVYLILDPLWLRDCLSGIEGLNSSAMDNTNMFNASLSLSGSQLPRVVSQHLERDRNNGFMPWTHLESILFDKSRKLNDLKRESSSYLTETITLIRRVLQALNVIIPAGMGPTQESILSFQSPTRDFSTSDQISGSSFTPIRKTTPPTEEPIYLLPCLLLNGEHQTDIQKYPKAGCIQLEKRIYFAKYFALPDVIPLILARLYSNKSDPFIGPEMDIAADDPAFCNTHEYDSFGTEGFSGHCWKNAFSQQIDHIIMSVYVIDSSEMNHRPRYSQSSYGDISTLASETPIRNLSMDSTNISITSLPTEGNYIRVTAVGHVLMVHKAVRLISKYWEVIQHVLSSCYPGVEYEKYSLCPLCLMKQLPSHECGVFNDGESDLSSCDNDENNSDDEDGSITSSHHRLVRFASNNDLSEHHLDYDHMSDKSIISEDILLDNLPETEGLVEDTSQIEQSVSISHDQREYIESNQEVDSIRFEERQRKCCHNCLISSDFYLPISSSCFRRLYPTSIRLQIKLLEYISCQLYEAEVSTTKAQNTTISSTPIVTAPEYSKDSHVKVNQSLPRVPSNLTNNILVASNNSLISSSSGSMEPKLSLQHPVNELPLPGVLSPRPNMIWSPRNYDDIQQFPVTREAPIVQIRAYKFLKSNIDLSVKTDYANIKGEQEEVVCNGYIYESRGRKFVITSIVMRDDYADDDIDQSELEMLYVVDNKPSNEIYAAKAICKLGFTEEVRSSSSHRFSSAPTPTSSGAMTPSSWKKSNTSNRLSYPSPSISRNPTSNDMKTNDITPSLTILEIVSKIQSKSVVDSAMQSTILIHQQYLESICGHKNSSGSPYNSFYRNEFNKFQLGSVGNTVTIISYDKGGYVSKTYGRIVKVTPQSSGYIRGLSLISTKSQVKNCVPGALVVESSSNALIGVILKIDYRLKDVYYVATPKDIY